MEVSFLKDLVFGVPITSSAYQFRKTSKKYLPHSACQYNNSTTKAKQNRVTSAFTRTNKHGRKADSFANRVREHVRLGPKITDTVKGKLSIGAKILQVGGVEKVFMQLFSVTEGEKLLKAYQCYLSTTSGPIAGLLFISTEKVAFCSERTIKISSAEGELVKFHYKVLIPLKKIKCINQSENVKKPSQKYMRIVTVDDFDFWFMGFLSYRKAFKHLQQAVSQA
ncbi:hypothetical protein L6164_026195 [Bauhinia variegata]|uniref:Uncharacterized protein n=1 Tax=Bauhinia variegata TaxID=167791 RepID=A0ACB9LPL6_BAUVA|nr:hypothetical protein L6164_026195 [Bauhinia variegata]